MQTALFPASQKLKQEGALIMPVGHIQWDRGWYKINGLDWNGRL